MDTQDVQVDTFKAEVVPGLGISVTISAEGLAAMLVILAQGFGEIPNCFSPRDDLRVMDDPTWDDGNLTFLLSTPERFS